MDLAAAWKKAAKRHRHMYNTHAAMCNWSLRYGIVRQGHHLLYGWGSGHLMWLPKPLQRLLVKVWNNTACLFFGHDIYGPWYDEDGRLKKARFCSACRKIWPSPLKGKPSWMPANHKDTP